MYILCVRWYYVIFHETRQQPSDASRTPHASLPPKPHKRINFTFVTNSIDHYIYV